MKIRWIVTFVITALFLANCSPSGSSGQETDLAPMEPKAPPMQASPNPETDNPLPEPEKPNYPDTGSVPAEKFIDLARRDLASLLGLETDAITVTNTQETAWPDTALGCPAPGKVYTSGKIPGYRIWLSAEGIEYIYHAGTNGQIVYCPEENLESSNPLSPASTNSTPRIGVPID